MRLKVVWCSSGDSVFAILNMIEVLRQDNKRVLKTSCTGEKYYCSLEENLFESGKTRYAME